MLLTDSKGVLQRANPKTIQNKFLVGYQGWFTCAGDGAPIHNGHHGWLHWFNKPLPDGGRPNTDLWPDVSEYSPSELYPAPGLSMEYGGPAFLFSSRNAKTVKKHFHWMAMHGVDGAFLQRFAGQCESNDVRKLRDEVGDRVVEAAEQEGRVFAIMYDVSGVPNERIQRVIETDWSHLIYDKGILDSKSYLREKGKPVVALWGFGFSGRGHDPETVRNIVRHIKTVTPGGAYVMAGIPTYWRTLDRDADSNPGFLDIWFNEVDAISPWTVGRFGDEEGADRFAAETVKKDMEVLHDRCGDRKVDYLPVVFPGFSGENLSEGKWKYNQIPRQGGKFLWRQIHNARHAGARTLYGAMWDEYDEGTAYMPVVSSKSQLPKPGKFLALDADGHDLPADWYMRICGYAAEAMHGDRTTYDTFPIKELQDYWSSRPHYEEGSAPGGSGSSASASDFTPYQPAAEEEEKDEPPPPPYTLEASENEAVPLESTAPPVPTNTRPAVSVPSEGSASTSANLAQAQTHFAGPSAVPIVASGSNISASSASAQVSPAVNNSTRPVTHVQQPTADGPFDRLPSQLHPPASQTSPHPPAQSLHHTPSVASTHSSPHQSPHLTAQPAPGRQSPHISHATRPSISPPPGGSAPGAAHVRPTVTPESLSNDLLRQHISGPPPPPQSARPRPPSNVHMTATPSIATDTRPHSESSNLNFSPPPPAPPPKSPISGPGAPGYPRIGFQLPNMQHRPQSSMSAQAPGRPPQASPHMRPDSVPYNPAYSPPAIPPHLPGNAPSPPPINSAFSVASSGSAASVPSPSSSPYDYGFPKANPDYDYKPGGFNAPGAPQYAPPQPQTNYFPQAMPDGGMPGADFSGGFGRGVGYPGGSPYAPEPGMSSSPYFPQHSPPPLPPHHPPYGQSSPPLPPRPSPSGQGPPPVPPQHPYNPLAPPLPPRPLPSQVSGSSFIGFAGNAVGTFAGPGARHSVEKGLDTLAKSSSKFLRKFT